MQRAFVQMVNWPNLILPARQIQVNRIMSYRMDWNRLKSHRNITWVALIA